MQGWYVSYATRYGRDYKDKKVGVVPKTAGFRTKVAKPTSLCRLAKLPHWSKGGKWEKNNYTTSNCPY